MYTDKKRLILCLYPFTSVKSVVKTLGCGWAAL